MGDLNPPRGFVPRLLWRVRRHFAVYRYLTKLPKLLLEDYGHGGPYRPKQVEATIGRHEEFSTVFLPYAQALFCDEEALKSEWRQMGVKAEYETLRSDLGRAYFANGSGGNEGGDIGGFSYAAVGRYSAEHGGGYGGYGGHGGGEGGGHHGGDGGHGGGDGGGGH